MAFQRAVHTQSSIHESGREGWERIYEFIQIAWKLQVIQDNLRATSELFFSFINWFKLFFFFPLLDFIVTAIFTIFPFPSRFGTSTTADSTFPLSFFYSSLNTLLYTHFELPLRLLPRRLRLNCAIKNQSFNLRSNFLPSCAPTSEKLFCSFSLIFFRWCWRLSRIFTLLELSQYSLNSI